MTHPTNPYLAWLDGRSDPPFPGLLEEVRAARKGLIRKAAGLSRRFHAATGLAVIEHHQAWVSVLEQVNAFQSWLDVTYRFQAKTRQKAWAEELEGLRTQADRLRHRHHTEGGRALLKTALRRKRLDADTRRVLWDGLATELPSGPEAARVRLLATHQEARERTFATKMQKAPGVYVASRSSLGGINTKYLEEAAAVARARGWRQGYVFLPHTEGATALLSYAQDTNLRRSAWLMNQCTAANVSHVEGMRVARAAEAKASGYGSWMERATAKYAVGSVENVERLLGTALDALRPAARTVERQAVVRAGHRIRQPLDASWDHGRIWMASGQAAPPVLDPQVFPWFSTIEKALPELLAVGGWRLRSPLEKVRKGASPVVRLRLDHPSHGAAQLFYAPCDPSFTPFDYAGAFALPVRSSREGERIVWIGQSLPEKSPSFDLWNLTKLAHEVGHALHYLSLEGRVPGEAEELPGDMMELPSYLLELYPRDPRVLVRWAHTKASRRQAFWDRHLAFLGDEVLNLRAHSMNALLDVQSNRWAVADRAFLDLHADILKRGRFDLAEEGRATHAKNTFIWNPDWAGHDSSHIFGHALVHRLMVLRADGKTSAPDVAALYADLVKSVLSGSTSAQAWRKRWRHWMKESPVVSVHHGLRSLGHHHRRVVAFQKKRSR